MITVGTPPHHENSPKATINILKLNEVTRLAIDEENTPKKGKKSSSITGYLLGTKSRRDKQEKNEKNRDKREKMRNDRFDDVLSYREVTEKEREREEGVRIERRERENSGDFNSADINDGGEDGEENDGEGGGKGSEGGGTGYERNSRKGSLKGIEKDGEKYGEKDREKDRQREIENTAPSTCIYIAVQQLGSGRVVRIVNDIADFDQTNTLSESYAKAKKVRNRMV